MIYDIKNYNKLDLIKDERLISSLMTSDPSIMRTEAIEKIRIAFDKCKAHRPKPKPVKSNDHQPCQECGFSKFERTGTCFVCVTCGASQGCS